MTHINYFINKNSKNMANLLREFKKGVKKQYKTESFI